MTTAQADAVAQYYVIYRNHGENIAFNFYVAVTHEDEPVFVVSDSNIWGAPEKSYEDFISLLKTLGRLDELETIRKYAHRVATQTGKDQHEDLADNGKSMRTMVGNGQVQKGVAGI